MIIENIKGWPVQKKVFYGLAAATILTGLIYSGIKLSDFIKTQKSRKNKNK